MPGNNASVTTMEISRSSKSGADSATGGRAIRGQMVFGGGGGWHVRDVMALCRQRSRGTAGVQIGPWSAAHRAGHGPYVTGHQVNVCRALSTPASLPDRRRLRRVPTPPSRMSHWEMTDRTTTGTVMQSYIIIAASISNRKNRIMVNNIY